MRSWSARATVVVMSNPDGATDGLFSPDSVTWRVHAEPLMGLAALRALLLQALHPVSIAVLDQHSSFGHNPWPMLTRITEFVGSTTFGTAAEAMLAGSRVRAVHARINATTLSGASYTADDPQLLAWMHGCLVASFLEVVTRGGLRLSPTEQDAYLAEQVTSAMLVGLEPHQVPSDRAQLRDYFSAIRPVLECTPPAREAADRVIHGSGHGTTPAAAVFTGPFGAVSTSRPAWTVVGGLAYAALPPFAQRLYGIANLPGPAGLTVTATTLGLKALNVTLRHGPS